MFQRRFRDYAHDICDARGGTFVLALRLSLLTTLTRSLRLTLNKISFLIIATIIILAKTNDVGYHHNHEITTAACAEQYRWAHALARCAY